MGATYIRGGQPFHINRSTASNTLEEWPIERATAANWLWFKNTGANDIILSLERSAAETVPSVGVTVGTTVGVDDIYEGPAEISGFWTRSAVGVSAFQAIAYLRRG